MLKKSRIPICASEALASRASKAFAFTSKAIALAAFLAIALAPNAFADYDCSTGACLDIFLRDFQAKDRGFEMFDTDLDGAGTCAGSNPDRPNTQAILSNKICIAPGGSDYVTCDQPNVGALTYGEYAESPTCPRVKGNLMRGYKTGPDVEKPALPGGGIGSCKDGAWQNDVYVTKGIVNPKLKYDRCPDHPEYRDAWKNPEPGKEADYLKGRHCAYPEPAPGAETRCNGENVSLWYTDGAHTKTVATEMFLGKVAGSGNVYQIKHDYNTYKNWNTFGEDNGYFPLDEFDEQTFGKQSLNVWCPNKNPSDYGHYDWDYGQDCFSWRTNGGTQIPTAALATAQQRNIMHKLHNYSFTMAGSAEFKYNSANNDIFEFIGDDDMWIFIDGELVVDLGGCHLAAPAKINIKDYGLKEGKYTGRDGGQWADESMHAINFFYADRQTEGSNMMLKLAITDLTPSTLGAPRIVKAMTVIEGDKVTTMIYVTSKLELETIKKFEKGNNGFPILVTTSTDTYAYRLESVNDNDGKRLDGYYTYNIVGQVCADVACSNPRNLTSGDSLHFNIAKGNLNEASIQKYKNAVQFGLPDDLSLNIMNVNKKKANALGAWGPNSTNRGNVPIDIKPTDPTAPKPDFVAGGPGNFTGNGSPQQDGTVPIGSGGPVNGGNYDASGKIPDVTMVWDSKTNTMVPVGSVPGVGTDNGQVHGFGTVGKQIPPQRAGELILTAFPSAYPGGTPPYGYSSYEEWLKDYSKGKGDAQFFGLPPEAFGNGAWWGLVNPIEEKGTAGGGGYAFVKNGFPNESNTKGKVKMAPTRCTSVIDKSKPDGEKANINCLNFNFQAQQPFQLAVTVYDQLGNFVTQYRETVTEQEFRNVTQAASFLNAGKEISEPQGCAKPAAGSGGPGDYGHPSTLTVNGLVNVNVNVYPFSTTGKRFGNGVYIVKVDKVDLPFTGCNIYEDGTIDMSTLDFGRTHAEQKFGWMRTK
ncbi:MAG: fibro-slime domain-containing protein [Fibromonadaceae bacterium]|jgi:fibro-slime domain-containing protein|nr:fibro-slime domain-containing protein [Fibromonadaceae bacterium]